jgi:hypothetical protein
MNISEIINKLIDKDYTPYALTINFKQSEALQELYPDYLLYDGKNNELPSNDVYKIGMRTEMIEKAFRKILNKLSGYLLNTANITRNNYRIKSPIIFYFMELMKWSKRQESLMTIPGTRNICPLHYHALTLVHPEQVPKMDSLIGDETLQMFESIIQHSRLDNCSNVNGWLEYIQKDQYTNYAACCNIYPEEFKVNPELFLLASK